MYLERHYRNTIRAYQESSETLRTKRPGYVGLVRKLSQSLGPNPHTCQWIEGEPSQRAFCCAAVRAGSSYCEAHHQRCYRPLTPETKL